MLLSISAEIGDAAAALPLNVLLLRALPDSFIFNQHILDLIVIYIGRGWAEGRSWSHLIPTPALNFRVLRKCFPHPFARDQPGPRNGEINFSNNGIHHKATFFPVSLPPPFFFNHPHIT